MQQSLNIKIDYAGFVDEYLLNFAQLRLEVQQYVMLWQSN